MIEEASAIQNALDAVSEVPYTDVLRFVVGHAYFSVWLHSFVGSRAKAALVNALAGARL